MLFWVPTNGKSYRKWPTEKSGNHSLTVIFQRDSTSECESDIYSRYIYIVVQYMYSIYRVYTHIVVYI